MSVIVRGGGTKSLTSNSTPIASACSVGAVTISAGLDQSSFFSSRAAAGTMASNEAPTIMAISHTNPVA